MFLIRPEARFSPQEQLSQTRVPASPNIQIRSQRPFNPRKPTHNATAPRGAAVAPGKSDSVVDVASFEGGTYDSGTYDLWYSCQGPSPAAAVCAYGVVVDNELHRLDDASNEMVAAAVADTGPEANWFVTISGERGDDGHVSIDRIDDSEEGTSPYLRWCWPWGCGDDVLALGDD